jgi:hypothetical protein
MLIMILFSLKFNIIFLLRQNLLFLTYIQDPDPHSCEKLDPDPHSCEKLDPDPHEVNADPKHWCKRSMLRREIEKILYENEIFEANEHAPEGVVT